GPLAVCRWAFRVKQATKAERGCGQSSRPAIISNCDAIASRLNQLVKVALSLTPIDKLGSPRTARIFGRADGGMGALMKLAANKSHTMAPKSRTDVWLANRTPPPTAFIITTNPLVVGTMKRLANIAAPASW